MNIGGYSKLVHRMVAEAFIPNPHHHTEVHHRNYDKTDNSVENLLWCNHKRHMGKHQSIPIVRLNSEYEIIEEYSSAAEAERRTGIPASTIRSCCNRENHTTRNGDCWMHREEYNRLISQNTIITVNPIISIGKKVKK